MWSCILLNSCSFFHRVILYPIILDFQYYIELFIFLDLHNLEANGVLQNLRISPSIFHYFRSCFLYYMSNFLLMKVCILWFFQISHFMIISRFLHLNKDFFDTNWRRNLSLKLSTRPQENLWADPRNTLEFNLSRNYICFIFFKIIWFATVSIKKYWLNLTNGSDVTGYRQGRNLINTRFLW